MLASLIYSGVKMKQIKGLKNQAGFFGALASTVIGGMLSKGGSKPAKAAQSFTSPFSTNGGIFAGTGFQDGNLNMSMSPEMQAASDQGLAQNAMFGGQAMNDPGALQQRQMGMDMLSAAGSNDPLALQQALFQQQAGLMQPMFQQQQLDQEGRLFAQGRLGSTAGGNQQQALMQSQNNTFGQMLNNAFGQSQQQQAQQIGLGQGLMSGGVGLQGMLQGMGAAGLQQPLGIQDAMNSTLQTGGNIARQGSGAVGASTSPLGAVGQGLLAGGAQGIGDALGGLFQPGPSTPGIGVNNPTFMGAGVSPSATINSTF
jgi:hypothetical protein